TKLIEQLFDYDNVSDYLPGYDEINAEENDTDDHNVNINEVVLKVDDSFNNWDAVQVTVDSFAKQNSFVANKCRKDLDPVDKSIIRRSGVHQPKKVEDIDLHHNSSSTIELAPKNLSLSQKILDKIEHYTTHGHLGASQQYNLIVKEFSQYSIKKKNLYNVIHKFYDKLVNIIEQELEKKAQYTRIKNYYGFNLSIGLMLTYNTIFKKIDSILNINLAPILLSLQRAQIKQALLYQEILISVDQVKELDANYNDIIERLDDVPQIHLAELMIDIPYDAIKELWEVSYIGFASKPNYVVILNNSTLLLKTCDVYTPAIRSHINKKVQFGTTMSVAKTSVQIAVSESVTEELTGLLVQFIMKYHHDTGLGIKDTLLSSNIMLQEFFITEVMESTSNHVSESSTITQ
ncbi:16254_t:CDS:2, partial [Cetraspora pellucida]